MNLPKNPKIALAGSVNSSYQTLMKLHEHGMDLAHVFALDPIHAARVSGYKDLKVGSDELGISSSYFEKINEASIYETIVDLDIDVLFVIGLSQLVHAKLLNAPKFGCIGFHPTLLPKGRGRAAIAWSILKDIPAGVTFFRIDDGVDSGPILAQRPIIVDDTDYAFTLIEKIKSSIDITLDELLPKLKEGEVISRTQDNSEATYLGVRRPQDGAINWKQSATEVYRLIRASSHPYPGAFSSIRGARVTVYRAKLRPEYTGVPGRIIAMNDGAPIICCGNGAIELIEFIPDVNVDWKIGLDFDE